MIYIGGGGEGVVFVLLKIIIGFYIYSKKLKWRISFIEEGIYDVWFFYIFILDVDVNGVFKLVNDKYVYKCKFMNFLKIVWLIYMVDVYFIDGVFYGV